MTLIIQEDDYSDVNCHELESNGEIEVHWDHPELPGQWSFRHAEWEPRCRREDPNFDRNWTDLEPVTENSSQGIWRPYQFLLKKFFLEKTNLPAEEILKLSPSWLRSLTSRVNPPIKCKQCGNTTFCSHDIGRSGNDPVDDFRLNCPKCGKLEEFVHVDMGNDPETCPWCGKKTFGN